jgi:type I restriction enzyme S subunit
MDAIIDYRGKTPRKTRYGIPLITAKVVKNGRIETPDEFIDPFEYDDWMRRGLPNAGDVLLTTEAPLGEVAQLRDARVALAQRLIALRGRPGELDNTFLKFLMQSDFVQDQLRARSTGTTVVGIKQSELRQVLLPVPAHLEQRAIACILGALDDKIELNRRMNRTLEAMARALFQSWFVDFDPVRAKLALSGAEGAVGQAPAGLKPEIAALFPDRLVEVDGREVPEGWLVGIIGDYVNCVKGKSYRSEELQDSNTALVTLKSFARGGGYRVDGLKAFTGDFKPQQVIQPGELVVACTDVTQAAEVIGRPAIVQSSSVFDTLVASLDVLIVRPRLAGLSVSFLYCLFRTDDFVNHTYAHSTGTTVLHLSKEAVPSFAFPVPPQLLLTRFGSTAAPIFSRIDGNERESRTLAALRDTLLPKLISGALRVADAERVIDRCL